MTSGLAIKLDRVTVSYNILSFFPFIQSGPGWKSGQFTMKTPVLKEHYRTTIIPELMKARGYKNIHEVPFVEKVVLNSGINASADKSVVEDTARDLGLIAGQKAVNTKARVSISNFKLRQGMPVGAKVTLRGARMYEFLYRFINLALPNIRDFRGVPTKLDGRGNYALGIDDHTIFPEIQTDGQKRTMGLDVCITTTATTDEEGRELLRLMGMPFRKSGAAAGTEAA